MTLTDLAFIARLPEADAGVLRPVAELDDRIAALRSRLAELEAEREREAARVLDRVSRFWSADEIAAARR